MILKLPNHLVELVNKDDEWILTIDNKICEINNFGHYLNLSENTSDSTCKTLFMTKVPSKDILAMYQLDNKDCIKISTFIKETLGYYNCPYCK